MDYRCKHGHFPVPVARQFKTPVCFPAVKQGFILKQEADKSTYLNGLDARKPLVVYISQRSKELRLYNLAESLTISNPVLKVVSSNASPG
jgi:hypothetical protein